MKAQIDLSNRSRQITHQQATEAANLFNIHGALQINQAFPKTLIRALGKEFNLRYLCQAGSSLSRTSMPHRPLSRSSLQVGDKRYLVPMSLEPPFNDPRLYAAKKVLPIIENLLGGDCVLHAFGAVVALPGAELQHFHIDHPKLFPESDGFETFLPPYAVHLSIPLINLNEKTGTTALWEGSHRTRFDTIADSHQASELLSEACFPYPNIGDCFLMDFRLWHRGTANQSNRARNFLYMVYSRNWFYDNHNYPKQRRLHISRQQFSQVPKQHRKLFAQYKK